MDNTNKKEELSISDIISIILFHIKSILIVAVCAAIIVFGASYKFSKTTYNYTGSLMIFTSVGDNENNNMTLQQAGQAFVIASYYTDTYIQLLQSNNFCSLVQNEAAEILANEDLKNNSDKSLSQLKQEYIDKLPVSAIKGITSYSYQEDLLIFTISVSSQDRAVASAVCNAVLNSAPEFSKLFGEICELRVVDNPSGTSSKSNPIVLAAAAFILAAVLLSIVFVLIHLFDRRVKDEISLSSAFDIPVIGVIPDFDSVINSSKK